MSLTAFVLLALGILTAACAALVVVVRRQQLELDALRRWRHNLAVPALVRSEHLYALSHASYGLPSIEELQRRPRERSLPS